MRGGRRRAEASSSSMTRPLRSMRSARARRLPVSPRGAEEAKVRCPRAKVRWQLAQRGARAGGRGPREAGLGWTGLDWTGFASAAGRGSYPPERPRGAWRAAPSRKGACASNIEHVHALRVRVRPTQRFLLVHSRKLHAQMPTYVDTCVGVGRPGQSRRPSPERHRPPAGIYTVDYSAQTTRQIDGVF